MKLSDKGPILPPPELYGWAQAASLEIQAWPSITSAMHWSFGRQEGIDFYVVDTEIGHIHFDGEIHLVLTKPLRKAVLSSNLAQPFRWSADWVQYSITNRLSARHAVWLFRLACDHAAGQHEANLISRVEMDGLANKNGAVSV